MSKYTNNLQHEIDSIKKEFDMEYQKDINELTTLKSGVMSSISSYRFGCGETAENVNRYIDNYENKISIFEKKYNVIVKHQEFEKIKLDDNDEKECLIQNNNNSIDKNNAQQYDKTRYQGIIRSLDQQADILGLALLSACEDLAKNNNMKEKPSVIALKYVKIVEKKEGERCEKTQK